MTNNFYANFVRENNSTISGPVDWSELMLQGKLVLTSKAMRENGIKVRLMDYPNVSYIMDGEIVATVNLDEILGSYDATAAKAEAETTRIDAKFKDLAQDAFDCAVWTYGFGGQFAIYGGYYIQKNGSTFSFYAESDLSKRLATVTL